MLKPVRWFVRLRLGRTSGSSRRPSGLDLTVGTATARPLFPGKRTQPRPALDPARHERADGVSSPTCDTGAYRPTATDDLHPTVFPPVSQTAGLSRLRSRRRTPESGG